MYLLEISKMKLGDRRDPTEVSRAMSALVGLSDKCFAPSSFPSSGLGPSSPWGLRYKMQSVFWLPRAAVPSASTCPDGGFPARGAPFQHQQPCWVPQGCGGAAGWAETPGFHPRSASSPCSSPFYMCVATGQCQR